MIYKVEPITITKELILSRVSEERIMEHYLGLTPKKGLYKSTIRKDNKPTVSFYRNKKGELIYKDFGYPEHCGNFITMVMIKFGCSYGKALQIIANDFNIISRNNITVNKPLIKYTEEKFEDSGASVIQVEIKEYTQKELDWWAKYGITLEILKKYKVYSVKNVFLNGELFYTYKPSKLVFGYYGGIREGIETWRAYYINNKRYRFLSNWKSNQLQGEKQLPKEGEYLVITKSQKDVMTLYSFGIPAVAPISENCFISEAQYKKFKERFKNIILLYDNDFPGFQAVSRIHKKYPEIPILWIPRDIAKDISDVYKLYGKEKVLELIENGKEAIRKFNEKRETETSI